MDNNLKKELTDDGFSFTYSAKDQEEIKRIRQKYQPREVDKMERLRKLDAGVGSKAIAYSLALGIVGALIMGCGMSLTMTELGAWFDMAAGVSLTFGIAVGVLGMVIAGFAYPVYNAVLKKERNKIAPEILRLTEELMR